MTFEELNKKWTQLCASLEQEVLDNIYVLLLSRDVSQVRSSFNLLMSLDECALCTVLHEVEGQIEIREDVVAHHHLLWARCLLEEVMQEDSCWYDLFQRNGFRRLSDQLYTSISWDSMSEDQKDHVIAESLQAVDVPAGSFLMGARSNETAYDYERPLHKVTLSRRLRVCVYPCTQGLYEWIMDTQPSGFAGVFCPVEQVSWCSAVLFCNKLSEREGFEPCYLLPGDFRWSCTRRSDWNNSSVLDYAQKVRWNRSANGYRLLTEAEWEYCARGGEEYQFSGSDNIDEVAWYFGNSEGVQPVGEKKSNGFGLYDMSGNVWEWCWDAWERQAYTRKTNMDPVVDTSSSNRARRGGGWRDLVKDVRISRRGQNGAANYSNNRGFRLLEIFPKVWIWIMKTKKWSRYDV